MIGEYPWTVVLALVMLILTTGPAILSMAWTDSESMIGASARSHHPSHDRVLDSSAPEGPMGSTRNVRDPSTSGSNVGSRPVRRLRIHPAQVLLSALGKTAFSSQTFADIDGAPRKPTIRHGPWAVQRLQLEDDNRHGMGVLFCVNTTDLRGRRATNITGIAAYFIDLDGPPLPSSWPLPPTAVVESSPGRYHVYWRVMRAPMDLFTHVQKHLVVLFGSDPKVHDLPRVMRLPGLVHAKREPFVSRLVLVEPANAYEHDAFIAAFAVPPLKAPLRQAVRQMPRRGEMKYYVWAAVKGEYWRVASASEGTRNTTLFAAAVSLGTLVGAGFLAEADARDALLAGVSASPTPLPAWEAERTIASGLAFGRRHPRQLDAGDG